MYATVEEANEYISTYYSSTDPLRISWEALSNEDKQVHLNRSEQLIDQLPLKGQLLDLNQKGAFPRNPYSDISLGKAKIATIELSIQRLDSTKSDRATLIAQGVKSYKIGDLSETFRDGYSYDSSAYTISIVYPYLKEWLSGGYTICPIRTCK